MLQYSLIVCTYNRASFLKETIKSILRNLINYTKFELLIIDNNSTDNTAEVVWQFEAVPVVRYVLEKEQGLSNARNRGIKEAKYPIIVFLDDDIELDGKYLTLLDQIYKDPSMYIVGGKVLPYKSQVPEWLPKKYHYLVSVFDIGDKPDYVPKLMGANHSYRKVVADDVGEYNTNIGPSGDFKLGGDENEFLYRSQQQGYKLFYHPDLIVYHKVQHRFNKDFVLKYSYNIGASEANIDYLHRKGLLAIKSAKYILDTLTDHIGFPKKAQDQFVKELRREHKKGYLKYIRSRFGK